jgi:hypothetical protein
MNDARDVIFADARGAREQHRRVFAGRHLARERAHALHGRRHAKNRRERERARESIAQGAQFAAQARHFKGAHHAARDVIRIDRLVRVVERAAGQRRGHHRRVFAARENDDRRIGIAVAHTGQHGQGFFIRHAHVEQHGVDARIRPLDGIVCRLGLDDLVAIGTQALGERPPHGHQKHAFRRHDAAIVPSCRQGRMPRSLGAWGVCRHRTFNAPSTSVGTRKPPPPRCATASFHTGASDRFAAISAASSWRCKRFHKPKLWRCPPQTSTH